MPHTVAIPAAKLHPGHHLLDTLSRRPSIIKTIIRNADESLRVITALGEFRMSPAVMVKVCA